MNLNEHLEKLQYKSRLTKKLLLGFSFLVIIVSLLRFNDSMEKKEINKNKNTKTFKFFQENQKKKDSVQREKARSKGLKN